jgi:hypothetical protein
VPTWPNPPPYGQKRDGHPHLRERRAFGHPTPTDGCLHGQRRGGERLPLWPSPKSGSLLGQRRGWGAFGPYGHPPTGGAAPFGLWERVAAPHRLPSALIGMLWPSHGQRMEASDGGRGFSVRNPPCDCRTRMGAALWGPLRPTSDT